MNTKALHTKVIDSRIIDRFKIIQEDQKSYPSGKSNIYALDSDGKIIWEAELPFTDDIYPNPIKWDKVLNSKSMKWDEFYIDSPDSLTVSSQRGITVSISYRTGRIVQSEFTK